MRAVGRYEVLHEIGRGGMAVVYLARQRGLDRLVALKEMNSVHANVAELNERFFRESRLVGSLNHPNIVTVHDYLEEGGTPYIAMEYLPRGSLRPWVGGLSLAQLAGVLEGLLAGLASAADPAGIVHRDLKPENIMVAADGRVKIADFGIAKATQSASTAQFMTATGAAIGTPAYMAPEQALSKEIGPWTDLYSVGVIAYEQIAGRVPFHDSDAPMAILMRHVNEPIPPLLEVKPEVPPALSEWVDRLLVKEPSARTASAVQAWEELEEIVLELLGARWRRDARLTTPESGAQSRPRSLTPAPFATGAANTSDAALTGPEIESGFLSYERAAPGGEGDSGGREPKREEPTRDPPAREPPVRDIGNPDPVPAIADATPGAAPARGARRLGPRWMAVTALAAATAVAVGFAGASSGGHAAAPPAFSGSASVGSLEVSLPPNWRRGTSTHATPALRLSDPLSLASSSSPPGALVIGSAATTAPTLLPASLLAVLPHPPQGEAVRLGGKEFYRYRNLRPTGSNVSETIYALPTTADTLLGVCIPPQGNTSLAIAASKRVLADCERILGSLTLISGSALPLGPNPRYATALGHAIAALNRSRSSAGSQLAGAKTAAGQARAAALLASANARAAAAVRATKPGALERSANSAIEASLARLARDYLTLAGAARNEDSRGFDRARQTIAKEGAAFTGALMALRTLGYRIGS